MEARKHGVVCAVSICGCTFAGAEDRGQLCPRGTCRFAMHLGVKRMWMTRKSLLYRSARWMYRPLRNFKDSIRRKLADHAARRTVRRYLRTLGFKALHAGCGPHRLDAWLNSDLLSNTRRDLFVDITRPLPIPDSSLDAIYASEVIEHVSEQQARGFFREALRTLKPGGALRLTTPDLAEIC